MSRGPDPKAGPVLVTGGAGFIGANLADSLAQDGFEVRLFDSLARPGVARNVAWLASRHGPAIRLLRGDVRDGEAISRALEDAQAVFHLAAQVAVTTSLENPRSDFEINALGTLNLLEALRARQDPPPLFFASTNKIYGPLRGLNLQRFAYGWRPVDPALDAAGVSERQPLELRTPYGCSKGAAEQYVLDYAASYGLPVCVLRLSCVYGKRQMGGEDQGWVAHFARSALQGQPVTIFGDGLQVRDVLDVRDAVAAFRGCWRRLEAVRGEAFNLGGGPANAVSITELIEFLEERLGRGLAVRRQPPRPGDQRWFVADSRVLRARLSLPAPRPWREGVSALLGWLSQEAASEAAA